MDGIINNISMALDGDLDNYSSYEIINIDHNDKTIIVKIKDTGKKYRISIEEINPD